MADDTVKAPHMRHPYRHLPRAVEGFEGCCADCGEQEGHAHHAPMADDTLTDAIMKLPRRVDYISGQQFSYVKLDDVLALIASTKADDTEDSDAVVMARIALLDYHVKRGLLFPGMDERNQELHGLIDALIAAVRAEQDEPGYETERRQQEKERPMSDKFPALQSMKVNAEVIVRRHAALHAPKVEARDVDAICRALGEISVDEATAALDRVQREGVR